MQAAGSLSSEFSADDTIPLHAQQVSARTVALQWESAGAMTEILRQYPDSSNYETIAVTDGSSYNDRHGRSVCGDTVRYGIRRGDTVGFAAVYVVDDSPTMPAEWGVVTVDEPSQQIILHWQASPDTDIMGYLVCEGSPSMAIDTVYGRESTEYIFLSGDVIQIYSFRICAFDSCRQAAALTETCNNIVLQLSAEPCGRSLAASWNAYQNMPALVGGYQVWVSEDDSPFRQVMVTAADVTTATFSVSEACQRVSVFVKAVSSDGLLQSLSNRQTHVFGTSERPSYLYLRKVSVSDDGNVVTVVGQTDPTFSGSDYKVYRRVGEGAASVVGHCTPEADGLLVWNDHLTHSIEQPFVYWLGVMDGCGRNEVRSQQAKVIVPIVSANGSEVTVRWNSYSGWDGTTGYTLLSSAVGSDSWQLVASGTDTVQADFLDGVVGQLRYKVIAAEGANSSHRHYDTLQSATVFYKPQTTIWMPDAFTPDEGSNNILLPRASYINPDGYSFILFNRAGQVVFRTNNPLAYWDGISRGVAQPMGAYTYIITFRQNDGTSQQIKGTVLLIR